MKNLLIFFLVLVFNIQTAFAGWGAGAYCSKEDRYCCIHHQVVCNSGCGCEGVNGTLTTYGDEKRTSPNPCDGVSGWRESICKFAKTHLVHFAWGYEHGIRDYLLSMELAKEEAIKVDEEVLFAAGLLHDMGGFPPYEMEGVDHALRSTQVVDEVLQKAGFPMEKSEAVKKAILTHSYYDPTPPQTSEAIVLHDADVLDFLGAISLARILSVAGTEKGITDPKSAVKLLTKFQLELPSKLYGGNFTKDLGQKRALELKNFLEAINQQTFSLGLPFHN